MSSPSPTTPTTDRILDAALALLEAGAPARMADIARAAGISRQAVYLHFPSRAELLVAATRRLDAREGVAARLEASRTAPDGATRLAAFVEAWAGYIPVVHGVSVALRAMRATDAEAKAAWDGRMAALREGCAAAVAALARDGRLRADLSEAAATDLLWNLLAIEGWERLVLDCGWAQERYVAELQRLTRLSLLD